MPYLAHTGHSQLLALWLSCIGCTLTAVSLGLIQWRVWLVSDREVISSGVAWVGVFRACFNSHTLVTPGYRVMHCRFISLMEDFTPPEIVAGQGKSSPIRLTFLTSGALCLMAAIMSLTPLLWNLNSVVTNQTITFPPEFKLPPTPDSQHVGRGIWVGLVGTSFMIVSGIIFCTYRLPVRSATRAETVTGSRGAAGGKDNPAFEFHEH
ncbi:hypothetical protein JOQ06_022122 [Pogonophryne albipinna]|uniref:Claudin-34 n=1 Tax=Pogonophryne albipinna TaxID=1090488 RepID=A0AAD6F487_9TELE|nr:hypothetical protein JOQ06_022122 [Pogonophryne albipinna]